MAGQRSSGPATQPSRLVSSQALPSIDSEVFQRLPLGLAIVRLENPKDLKSYRIIEVNPAAAQIAGSTVDGLRGRTLADLHTLLRSPLATQWLDAVHSFDLEHVAQVFRGDKRIGSRIYSVRVFTLSNNCIAIAFEDVTERRTAEQIIAESEGTRSAMHDVRDYAFFQLDYTGHVVSWNAGAERLKGYHADEIIGKHFSVFYPSEAVAQGRPQQMLADAIERGHSEDDGWRIRKDGSRFWANVVVSALRDSTGALRGFVKLTRDMTEMKEKEVNLTKAREVLEWHVQQRTAVLAHVNQQLRAEIGERERAEQRLKISRDELRALTARLETVREEERKSVAREIHDELGQACTAIKMDLALISGKAQKRQTRLKSKIASTLQVVDEMIATLRRISSELRPRPLDDLGLSAALEWQSQEFERRTGVSCQIILPQQPVMLDPERSTAVFRIFQESLTNIARHSRATRVDARLDTSPELLTFEVRDNGCGFDAEAAKAGSSLGLVGMRERALLLNGELRIESVPGSGTTLTLRIPFPTDRWRAKHVAK
jgi:PAS domain S-box-containing protein